MVMSSIRLDQAGRLIIGSVGSLGPIANTAHIRWAHHKLNRLFPALGEVEFEYQWHGRIAYNADHLPKIVGLGPNAISLNGYNGRGISPGTVFGRAAADYVMSGNTDSLPIPVLSEYRESFTSLKRAYYEFGVTAIHSLESLV